MPWRTATPSHSGYGLTARSLAARRQLPLHAPLPMLKQRRPAAAVPTPLLGGASPSRHTHQDLIIPQLQAALAQPARLSAAPLLPPFKTDGPRTPLPPHTLAHAQAGRGRARPPPGGAPRHSKAPRCPPGQTMRPPLRGSLGSTTTISTAAALLHACAHHRCRWHQRAGGSHPRPLSEGRLAPAEGRPAAPPRSAVRPAHDHMRPALAAAAVMACCNCPAPPPPHTATQRASATRPPTGPRPLHASRNLEPGAAPSHPQRPCPRSARLLNGHCPAALQPGHASPQQRRRLTRRPAARSPPRRPSHPPAPCAPTAHARAPAPACAADGTPIGASRPGGGGACKAAPTHLRPPLLRRSASTRLKLTRAPCGQPARRSGSQKLARVLPPPAPSLRACADASAPLSTGCRCPAAALTARDPIEPCSRSWAAAHCAAPQPAPQRAAAGPERSQSGGGAAAARPPAPAAAPPPRHPPPPRPPPPGGGAGAGPRASRGAGRRRRPRLPPARRPPPQPPPPLPQRPLGAPGAEPSQPCRQPRAGERPQAPGPRPSRPSLGSRPEACGIRRSARRPPRAAGEGGARG